MLNLDVVRHGTARRAATPEDQERVVTTALIRAADRMGLSGSVLAMTVGLSEAQISRLRHGQKTLSHGSKPFELALAVIRLYRSLDAIAGGDERVVATWLHADNVALGAPPVTLIISANGLFDVIAYLDARRAVV